MRKNYCTYEQEGWARSFEKAEISPAKKVQELAKRFTDIWNNNKNKDGQTVWIGSNYISVTFTTNGVINSLKKTRNINASTWNVDSNTFEYGINSNWNYTAYSMTANEDGTITDTKKNTKSDHDQFDIDPATLLNMFIKAKKNAEAKLK